MQQVIDRIESEELMPAMQTLGEDFGLGVGGAADELASTQKSLMNSFYYAIGFIYLLLVALFASFLHPLIVMLTVVLAVSGSFLGIVGNNFLQRQNILDILKEWKISDAEVLAGNWNWITFDILTQLGIVILAGIVVNNAILIIHQMLNNIKFGMDEREALLKSCKLLAPPAATRGISNLDEINSIKSKS